MGRRVGFLGAGGLLIRIAWRKIMGGVSLRILTKILLVVWIFLL